MEKYILNKNSIISRPDLPLFFLIILFFSGMLEQNFSQQLAFPTAEGFGK